MDLHAWITQQVDQTEAYARAADPLLNNLIIQVGYVDAKTRADGQHIDSHLPAAVLRRCEADRRILTRHRPVDDGYSVACDGCGTAGICDDPVAETINDCPELLDLAHAHGITDEILAGLDRPMPPEPTMRVRNAHSLADTLGIATPPITTSDVPAALRGPRWKP